MLTVPEFDVPQIGDIRKASNYQKEVWAACKFCGKERWVRIIKGKPRAEYCSNGCKHNRQVGLECPNCGRLFKTHAYRLSQKSPVCCCFECAVEFRDYPSGDKHPMWNGGLVKQICKECGREFLVKPSIIAMGKGIFCSQVCHMINQRKSGMFGKPLNKVESQLNTLLQDAKLPFKYSGNGDVWLGNRNPDFINVNGKKQVIELFGTYWHPLFDGADRTEHYKRYGFDCLVIWEDELKTPDKVIAKLKKYDRKQELPC